MNHPRQVYTPRSEHEPERCDEHVHAVEHAQLELTRDSAHIRIVFSDATSVNLNCASADTAKTEFIKLRRTMEGI